MNPRRRLSIARLAVCAGSAGAMCFWPTAAFSAEPLNYPSRHIQLIVPFPPGGPNDVLARLIGQKLSNDLGQPVVVENKPGASTVIGTEYVAKAKPDGYTLLMISPSHVVNPSLRPKLPYDLLRDFKPVIRLAESPNILVVNPSFPVKTVQDLLALARAKPGAINYGSGGVGTATHLAGALLCTLGHVKMTHIPYKGDGPATIDLLGGRISWMFGTVLAVVPQIKAGELRAVAVSGTNRLSILPDVPPVADTLPGFDATSFYGVAAPGGTPDAIINTLNTRVNRILQSPELKQQLAVSGTEVVGGTPQEFRDYLQANTDKWRRVIREAGIKVE